VTTPDGNNLVQIAATVDLYESILNGLEWAHRILSLILIIAGILVIRSAVDLFHEPQPGAAIWLILEISAIALHLVGTALLNQIRQGIDMRIAQLRQQVP